MRSKEIQDIIWWKRSLSRKIKGYDLSNFYRKYNPKCNRYWEFGSITRLKAKYLIHRYNQLLFLVAELEEAVKLLKEKLRKRSCWKKEEKAYKKSPCYEQISKDQAVYPKRKNNHWLECTFSKEPKSKMTQHKRRVKEY